MTEEKKTERPMEIDILFSGPPGGPECECDFIEVESPPGKSIKIGRWVQREKGMWALRLRALRGDIRKGTQRFTQSDDDYLDDLMVWKIKVSQDQRIWVTAKDRSGALAVGESLDYFEYSDDDEVSIELVPPGQILEVWMCHDDEELVPELLRPHIVKPDEVSEFTFLTVHAPCGLWAQSMRGRADLLADSEAYC